MRNVKTKKPQAFTLIELMITISIVGLLVAIAIPSYSDYIKKARYTELIKAAEPYKKAVDICYQTTGSLIDCRAGTNGVPQNISGNSTSLAAFIFTLSNGLIFVFPNTQDGFNMINDYYTVTPSINNGRLLWRYGGPGVKYISA